MKLDRFDILFLISIFLLFFCFIPPDLILSPQRLVGGDTTAHSYYPHIVKEQCIPSLQFMCWSNDLLMGYVVLQHYFPFIYVVSALLGFLINLNIAFKVIVFIALISPAICLFISTRLLGFSRNVSILSSVSVLSLMFTAHNLHMGFYILDNLSGQVSSTLALSLFFLAVSLLKQEVENKTLGIGSGCIMGCAFLSHAMLIPMLAAVAYFLLAILWKRDKDFFRAAAGSTLISVMLFAGWALPFIFDINHAESGETKKEISLNFYEQFFDPITTLIVVLGFLGILICCKYRNSSSRFLIAIILSCAFLTSISFVGNSLGTLAVFDRFFPALLMALSISAGVFLQWSSGKLHPGVCKLLLFVIILLSFSQIYFHNDTAKNWARWNFEGLKTKPAFKAYDKLAKTISALPGNGRVAIFAMNNSSLTGGLTGAFIWETIGLIAQKPILATGTQGFYTLSFRGVGEHYYAALASGNPEKLRIINEIYGISYIVKPASLPVSAFSDRDKLLASIDAPKGEKWEIYDVTETKGTVSYVNASKYQPVVYAGELSKVNVMANLYHDYKDLNKIETPVILGSPDLKAFPVIKSIDDLKPVSADATCKISDEKISSKHISFSTTCPGKAHQISISYNVGWQSLNGERLYQIIPNHLLIIPENEKVELVLKLTWAGFIGKSAFILGVLLCLANIINFARKKYFKIRKEDNYKTATRKND